MNEDRVISRFREPSEILSARVQDAQSLSNTASDTSREWSEDRVRLRTSVIPRLSSWIDGLRRQQLVYVDLAEVIRLQRWAGRYRSRLWLQPLMLRSVAYLIWWGALIQVLRARRVAQWLWYRILVVIWWFADRPTFVLNLGVIIMAIAGCALLLNVTGYWDDFLQLIRDPVRFIFFGQ